MYRVIKGYFKRLFEMSLLHFDYTFDYILRGCTGKLLSLRFVDRDFVRVPSRALFFSRKRTSGWMSFFRESRARQGSAPASGYRGLSPRKVGFGRCKAGAHRTPCTVSRSKTTYGNKLNCDYPAGKELEGHKNPMATSKIVTNRQEKS